MTRDDVALQVSEGIWDKFSESIILPVWECMVEHYNFQVRQKVASQEWGIHNFSEEGINSSIMLRTRSFR